MTRCNPFNKSAPAKPGLFFGPRQRGNEFLILMPIGGEKGKPGGWRGLKFRFKKSKSRNWGQGPDFRKKAVGEALFSKLPFDEFFAFCFS